jgi:hypothetical protein
MHRYKLVPGSESREGEVCRPRLMWYPSSCGREK